MDWHVLYVKSRAEKKVADRLAASGIEVFCPLRTEVRQWSDRKKKVEVPFFPSYVFVCFKPTQRLSVLQTPGVVRFVYWLRKPAIIREKEMAQVFSFFEKYEGKNVVSEQFVAGQQLKIQSGPMKSQSGVVLRQTKNKVVLQIEQLGVVLTVEVHKNNVVDTESA